jgi:prevent-host-death family protein
VQATEARDKFAAALNRVVHKGERVVVERYGRPEAALVPIADLNRIMELEDAADRRALKRARAELARHGTVPWSEARARLRARRRAKLKK